MTGFLADKNFDGHILDGARRRMPDINILRAQDLPIAGGDDPNLIEFATRHGRLLLTHDVKTVIGFANTRVRAGVKTCAVIEVH